MRSIRARFRSRRLHATLLILNLALGAHNGTDATIRVRSAPLERPYEETFDDGHGGWWAWRPSGSRPGGSWPSQGPSQAVEPEVRDGAMILSGPWWIDSNHAPPGAGYLHIVTFLWTRPDRAIPGHPNRFVEGGHSRDLRSATFSMRVRGEVSLHGARLHLLVGGTVRGHPSPYMLTGRPFTITREWSEQMAVLSADETLWTCLGARNDLLGHYACEGVGRVLEHADHALYLILFPLTVVPLGDVADPHALRPHRDYDVDRSVLPSGELQIDTIRISYPT